MQAEKVMLNFNEGRIRRQLRSYGIVTGEKRQWFEWEV